MSTGSDAVATAGGVEVAELAGSTGAPLWLTVFANVAFCASVGGVSDKDIVPVAVFKYFAFPEFASVPAYVLVAGSCFVAVSAWAVRVLICAL